MYLLRWSGTDFTVTVAIYWPILQALDADGDDCSAIS
jgi:hypothetical protein